jgi:hypothetical protein
MTEKLRGWIKAPPALTGIVLALLGILLRMWLWLQYQAINYGDTGAYYRLARVVASLNLDSYDGTRVPGYPALLALAGLQDERAWLLQMILGWMISLLLFWITWRTTDSAWVAFTVGALYNLIPGQLFFEANLLSETLTTFCVVLSFAILVGVLKARSYPVGLLLTFLAGVAASMVGMVRPLFFPLTLWYLPFVALVGARDWRRRLLRLAVYSIGPLLIQGGWLLFIFNHYKMVSPTTMAGYSLVQHTGEYFEYLPDEVASIRDTYIEYRDVQIAERGVQTNAIWEAIPALQEETGLSFYGLSREMGRLSRKLIREHPGLYLQNVVEGWVAFWKAPIYWMPSVFTIPYVRIALQGAALLGRGICILTNVFFLGMSALSFVSRTFRQNFGFDRFSVLAGGMVWMISILQTLVDHGDNPRFLVPLQMLVVYVVVRALWSWRQKRTFRGG